jgi:hypothetical protein
MNGTLKHTCPACGKRWECVCEPKVIAEHREMFSEHWEEIACSEKCGEQLAALLRFLRRYGK